MRNVLVIRFSSLGDVVLTAPVFQALRRAWPEARITALTKEAFADVFLGHPAIDRTMLLRKGESIVSLIRRVRRERFDVVIDLHSNVRSRWVSFFSAAKEKVRYRKAALARRFYVLWRWSSGDLREHTLDRYFQALRPLGIEVPPRKILVIQTAFLGDAVLTLPFLNALRDQQPGVPVTVLCTPEIEEIFKNHPAVAERVLFDKRGHDRGVASLFRIARELRAQHFSVVFLPHRSFKSAWVAWLAGIPRRIGFSSSQGRWLLTDVVPFRWGTHDADRNLSLLNTIGAPNGRRPTNNEFLLQPPPASQERVKDRLRAAGVGPEDRLLGINACSVWPTKRWLAEGFAAVADRAVRELGVKVIFFGGPADADAVNEVVRGMREAALNWAGETSLRELIAAVSRCSVFLTNDSGPLHVAVACRVPTVAVFGPTTKELGFFPYGPGHLVVEKDLPCRPCGLHGAKRCPLGHFRCMTTIAPEDVFAAVARQLEKGSYTQTPSPRVG
ncbi:MAG: lipopolysaccharide heptosyltransferase II, partial [Elusimicrobia bacterium RIFCSPLOWO2_01_FULL_59_12]